MLLDFALANRLQIEYAEREPGVRKLGEPAPTFTRQT
jgi:hypothetical protein